MFTELMDDVEEPKHWIAAAVDTVTLDSGMKLSFSWTSAMSQRDPMCKFTK
jgi:hypothetical protein